MTVGDGEGNALAQIRTSKSVSAAPSTFSLDTRHEPVVYWIRDHRDHVIYVGMTNSIWTRMAQHRQNSLWWSSGFKVEWVECESRKAARQLEIQEIARYQPEWNVQS